MTMTTVDDKLFEVVEIVNVCICASLKCSILDTTDQEHLLTGNFMSIYGR